MGGNNSVESDGNAKAEICDDCLSPNNIQTYFEEYSRKHIPKHPEAKAEMFLFSLLIDKIYSTIPKSEISELQRTIYNTIRQQVSPFLSQTNYFSDRLEYIINKFITKIHNEPIEYEKKWQETCKAFKCDSKTINEEHGILESIYEVFEEMQTIIISIPNEDLDEMLTELLESVDGANFDKSGYSATTVNKFTNFLVSLSSSPKLVDDIGISIKTKIIRFLLRVAQVNSDISTTVSALAVAMHVDQSIPFPGGGSGKQRMYERARDVDLMDSFTTIQLPIRDCRYVAANEDSIFLSSYYLYVYKVSEKRMIQTNIKTNYSPIAASNTHIAVLQHSQTGFILYCYSTSEEYKEVLNEKIYPSANEVSILLKDDTLYIASTVNFNITISTYRVTNSIEVKRTITTKLPYTNGHIILYNNLPAVYFPNSSSMFLLDEQRFVPSTVIIRDCSLYTSFGKYSYEIRNTNSGIDIKRYSDNYGKNLSFTPSELQLESNSFGNFVNKTVGDYSIELVSLIPHLFEDVPSDEQDVKQALQYFLSHDLEESLDSALRLGDFCLNTQNYDKEIRSSVLLFLLQIIAAMLRYYTFQFSYDRFELTPKATQIFAASRNFISHVIFYKYPTKELTCAAFLAVKAAFKYLFFPHYSEFADIISRIGEPNGISEENGAAALPYLQDSPAVFYAITPKTIEIMSRYHPPSIVSRLLDEQIKYINNEIFFITEHSLHIERYIATFVETAFQYFSQSLCMSSIITNRQEAVGSIFRLIARTIVLNKAPLVFAALAKSSASLLEYLNKEVTKTRESIQDDLEFANAQKGAQIVQTVETVFETDHPYKGRKECSYEMDGATSITIKFDPRCSTENTTDYLQIFDMAEGGSQAFRTLTGIAGDNWPSEIRIESDSCRFVFNADEQRANSSNNEWGILCTISANVPKISKPKHPDSFLSCINLLCFSLSKSISHIRSEFNMDLRDCILTEKQAQFLKEILAEGHFEFIDRLIRKTYLKQFQRRVDSFPHFREVMKLCIAALLKHTHSIDLAINICENGDDINKLSHISAELQKITNYLFLSRQKLTNDHQLVEEFMASMKMKVEAIIGCKCYFGTNPYYTTSIITSEEDGRAVADMIKEMELMNSMKDISSKLVLQFLKTEQLFSTGKITFISQIDNFDPRPEIKDTLLKLMIDKTLPNSLRLSILRVIVIDENNTIHPSDGINIINDLLDFNPQSVEEHVLFENMWLLVMHSVLGDEGNIYLDSLIQDTHSETIKYKLLSLLTVKAWTQFGTNVIEPQVMQTMIERLDNNWTPRLFVATMKLYSIYLCNKTRFINIRLPHWNKILKINGIEDIDNLLLCFLSIVGSSFIAYKCFDQNPSPESNLYIAEHILSIIRFMLKYSPDNLRPVIQRHIERGIQSNLINFESIGIMAVLGAAIPLAQGCYAHNKGSVILITDFSPLSDDVYGIDVNSLTTVKGKVGKLTPCVFIPFSQELYQYSKNDMAKFASYIKLYLCRDRIKYSFDFPMRILFIVLIFTLLPIILQDKNNAISFLGAARKSRMDLELVLSLPINRTGENSLSSIPKLMEMFRDNILYNNNKQQQNNSEEQMVNFTEDSRPKYSFDEFVPIKPNQKLMYSLMKANLAVKCSPDELVAIYGDGLIKDGVYQSTLPTLYVGNKVMINQAYVREGYQNEIRQGVSQFFFEVTLLEITEESKFSIGLIDNRTHEGQYMLQFPTRKIISPMCSNHVISSLPDSLQDGDSIGVGFVGQRIYFFYKGRRIPMSISAPLFISFTAMFLDETGGIKFSANFGDHEFTKGINDDELFGSERISTESYDYQTGSFQSDDILSTMYDQTVSNNLSVEIPPTPSFTKVERQTREAIQITTYVLERYKHPKNPLISVSAPVYVARVSINPNEASEKDQLDIGDDSRRFFHRMGTVVEMDRSNIKIEFDDATTGKKETSVIKSSFLEHTNRRMFKGTTYYRDIAETELIPELHHLAHIIVIRTLRYAFLSIFGSFPEGIDVLIKSFDDLKSENPRALSPKEESPQEAIPEIFSLLFAELIPFSPTIQVPESPRVLTDIIIEHINSKELRKKLEYVSSVVFRSHPEIFESLIKKEYQMIHNYKNESLVTQSPPHLRFSPYDQAKEIIINYKWREEGAAGFINIIKFKRPPKTNITIKGMEFPRNSCEYRYLPGSDYTIELKQASIDQSEQNDNVIALIPVYKYMWDSLTSMPIGSVHILLRALSLIFGFAKEDPNASKILRDFLPSAVSMMTLEETSPVGRLFAFDIVAPIITRLEWTDDIDQGTMRQMHEYLEKHYNDFNDEHVKMNVTTQQAILIKVMLDLNQCAIAGKKALDEHKRGNDKDHPAVENYIKLMRRLQREMRVDGVRGVIGKEKFEAVAAAFVRVASVTHNWDFPVAFPPFLLTDDFTKSNKRVILRRSYFKLDSDGNYGGSFKIENVIRIKITMDGINGVHIPLLSSSEIKGNSSFDVCDKEYPMWISPEQWKEAADDFAITIWLTDLAPKEEVRMFDGCIEEFLKTCAEMQKSWTPRKDEELLRMLKRTKEPLDFQELTEAAISISPVLSAIGDMGEIRRRQRLISELDKSLDRLLPFVDLSTDYIISRAIIAARAAIATRHKNSFFKSRVSDKIQDSPRQHLRFNRSRASLHMSRPNHPSAQTLLRQLIDQVPPHLIDSLKRTTVPWHVELIGEGATDAGGPARDIFTQMCIETMHPSTAMFIETPNKRNNIGQCQDVLIPDPRCTDDAMFEYTGVLMSIAYVSVMPVPLKFAEFVWAFLTGRELTIEDIYSVDEKFATTIQRLRGEWSDDFSKLYFTVTSATGEVKDLIPCGSATPITRETVSQYISLATKFRLDEMRRPLLLLRKGIQHFFPRDALALLSSWELELFVCGDTDVSIEELKKNCKYDENDENVKKLWQILGEFTSDERMLFIKFATGRMRLPPPGTRWQSDLQIHWVNVNGKDDEKADLPTAQTCTSTIKIPKYRSPAIMKQKILTAVRFGTGEIVMDRTQNVSDIVQLS